MCNCAGLKLDRVLADEQWRRFGGLFVGAEMIVSGGPTGALVGGCKLVLFLDWQAAQHK
jgi:hypothetical protein